MPGWYDRYRKGFYQEVYDELLAMHEHVFDAHIYEEALFVTREIMGRVRYNIELLIPRLQTMGYQFGKGFWNQFEDVSPEEKTSLENDFPIFKPSGPETTEKVVVLEQLTGTLPLSLKGWYEEVGCVNLTGLFSSSNSRDFRSEYGCVLDPLFIYSVEMAIKMVTEYIKMDVWNHDPSLALSPDNYYKYGFSGSGAYSIKLPCRAFDAPFLGERHHTTFVNYLRICFQWGGFPGLESDNRLNRDETDFLTRDLLRF